jgi:hypothetical protein
VSGCERSLHRHDLIAHQRIKTLEDAFIESATTQGGGTGKQHRARIGTGKRDAQVGKLAAFFPQGDRDTGDGVFD